MMRLTAPGFAAAVVGAAVLVAVVATGLEQSRRWPTRPHRTLRDWLLAVGVVAAAVVAFLVATDTRPGPRPIAPAPTYPPVVVAVSDSDPSPAEVTP